MAEEIIIKDEYKIPELNLLEIDKNMEENCNIDKENIENFFANYKVDVECKEVYKSLNSVTYVLDLKVKTKTVTIRGFKDDLLLYFGGDDIEFINAINGMPYYGICIRKNTNRILKLGNVIGSEEFQNNIKKIPLVLGRNVINTNIIEDLTKLPHLLIAGTVKTGKSSLLSSFIVEILYKLSPYKVRLVLIDTRKTNFMRFNGIPHLLIPTINEYVKAAGILEWLVQEMSDRYKLFNGIDVDNIDNYNKVSDIKLPRIVVMIEDFSDLMRSEMKKEIERNIVMLSQMSRAAGIHLILSTQRPSVDVLTGVIKANIPSRIAFNVPAQVDSRTILDDVGAEKLFIYGDILYKGLGSKPIRLQVPYVTDMEINRIVEWVKHNNNLTKESFGYTNKKNNYRENDTNIYADKENLDYNFEDNKYNTKYKDNESKRSFIIMLIFIMIVLGVIMYCLIT